MSDDVRCIAEFAAGLGFELAHGQESWGEHHFGLIILAKMSNRKLNRDKDWLTLNRAADAIRDGLETVSAQLDPEGSKRRESYRHQIEEIYQQAGVTAVYLEPLPNGYCSKPCCLNKPWFRVTSAIGHVVIGWRKSVMSIDWKDTLVKKTGEELFPTEDVTRWETGIHAWGQKAATFYIQRLHAPEARLPISD